MPPTHKGMKHKLSRENQRLKDRLLKARKGLRIAKSSLNTDRAGLKRALVEKQKSRAKPGPVIHPSSKPRPVGK
jgi:hypothetical protein